MKWFVKTLFASLTLLVFLIASSAYGVQISQGSNNYSGDVVKYLDKILLQAPKALNISLENTSREGNTVKYEYSLFWPWGIGSATIYVCSGKDYLIEYSLNVRSEKISQEMTAFLTKYFGLSEKFSLGNHLSIFGKAFPGTQIYFERVVDKQLSFNGFQFSLGVSKATVLFVNGAPVSGSLQLYSNFPLPPTAFQKSSLIKVCRNVMSALGISDSPGNETVELFMESKDLLGSVGGKVRISTLGKVRHPGGCSISMNSYGQITSAELDKELILSSLPSNEELKGIAIKDYLTFLRTLSAYSNNPEFSSFVTELCKYKQGEYMGGYYVLKANGPMDSERIAASCKLVLEKGKPVLGSALNVINFYNYTSPHAFTETMILQLYELPNVNLTRVSPKITSEDVSKEISSMLGSKYSIKEISLCYVPRSYLEMPEYIVKCQSSTGTLTLYIDGMNGEIVGVSYQSAHSQSESENWIFGLEVGLPVGIGIGVGIVFTYRRKK